MNRVASRRKAREIVLCLVFEKEYHKDAECSKLLHDLLELMENSEDVLKLKNTLAEEDTEYIKKTFFGVFENLNQIDDIISSSIISGKYNRVSKISMALLRIAVYEIMNAGESVSTSVAINEAVELSKIYDDSKAHGFVNGVLGSVAKNIMSA